MSARGVLLAALVAVASCTGTVAPAGSTPEAQAAASPAAAANASSPLGTNLAALTDYTAEYPFANLFKQAREWTSGNSETFEFDDGRSFNLDANGYVTSLKRNQIARAILFTGLPRDEDLNGRKLILRYKGKGRFEYSGATLLDHEPGRDVIRLGSGGPDDEAILVMNLVRTDPDDHARKIRLTRTGGICRSSVFTRATGPGDCPDDDYRSFAAAATAGDIVFDPTFLVGIRRFRSIRFMDWLRTNDSPLVSFDDRAHTGDAFWTTDAGVPLEAVAALPNILNADPWVNIPHRASNAFVRRTAEVLLNRLETQRRLYVEYTNESWNGIFTQAEYVQVQGEAAGLDQPDGDRFIAGLRFYSRRAQQIFDIFDDVYGADRAARVERVMASQAVNPFLTTTILDFEEAAQKTESFAIAPYFGDTVADADQAADIVAAGVDGVFSWLQTGSPDLGFGTLAALDQAVADQIDALDPYGIPLITYEGGQHFLAGGSVQNDEDLNAIFDGVNRDPRMKDAYLEYLANWRARSDEVFWHFLNSDRWSIFGRWGSREFPTQPRSVAPKYDALLTYIEQQPLT